MQLTLSDWASISAIAGTILALLALAYTALQVRMSRKVHQAAFWLELRKMFAEHNEIHLQLRGGNWSSSDEAPPSRNEWAKAEAYMGLFEHCAIMLDQGLLDWKTFQKIYRYRVINITASPLIVREKLIKRHEGWEVFLQLVRKLGLQAAMLETGRTWLDSSDGREWLSTKAGQDWLSTSDGREWNRIKGPQDAV